MFDFFSKIIINTLNPLVVISICNNYLAKLYHLFQNKPLPPQTLNLLEFMFEKELVSEVFKRDLYKMIEKTRDKNL